MNLVIDVGNTLVKVALYKGDRMISHDSFDKKDIYLLLKKIKKDNKIQRVIISSVASLANEEIKKIETLFPLIRLNSQTRVAFQNNYATPNSLGVDRIALMEGAIHKYPNENVLVIDAGTCITFDFLDKKGNYNGGAISPGIKMRYKALHQFTAKLPELEPENEIELIGNSTENSIHSGVVNGVLAEINGIIDKYNLEYEKLTVVLTGGDTYFLANRLKNSIFANPNFLLEGLNCILTHNSKND